MNELAYDIRHWEEEGCRHLRMKVNLLVKPYVRQTWTTRWGNGDAAERAQEYNEQQATIKDAVRLILLKEGIEPFGKTRLGLSSWFWLCPKKVFRHRRHSWVDDPARCDLNNLEKAVEDAMNGVLWHDDVWIWNRGRGFKASGDDDWFALYVWEPAEDETYGVDEWKA